MNAQFLPVRISLWLATVVAVEQIAFAQPALQAQPAPDQAQRGLLINGADTYLGFTLFTPLENNVTHLLNMSGEVVDTWNSDHHPANSVFILKNGDLLGCSKVMGNPRFGDFGPSGGPVERFSGDGNRL